MKKHLARILMAVLVTGLLTVNACAMGPTVSYENLIGSPFIPDFSAGPAPAPTIDSPFIPGFLLPGASAN